MPRRIERGRREVLGGALMLAIGLGAIWQGAHYPLGTLSRMGPGYFPVALGVILAVVGVVIAISGHLAAPSAAAPKLPPEWRAWGLIAASIVLFVVLGKWGGLLPATAAIVFVSALADRDNGWRSALLLALVMCLAAVVVFWWALQIQFPLFAWN